MRYQELTIYTSASGIEILTAELMELGIADLRIEDPRDAEERIAEAGETEYCDEETKARELEKEPAVIVYLEEGAGEKAELVRAMVARLREAMHSGAYGDLDGGSLRIEAQISDDAAWKDKWKAFFRPTRVSERLIVTPPWAECGFAGPEDTVLSIDPGMAFGTGLHATTALSLRLLERFLEPGDRVFDIGCGTGILAVAASKLGAGAVLATDIDEEAIASAKINLSANGVENATLLQGDLTEVVTGQADVIVANLLTNLVMTLTERVPSYLRSGGLYLSSGILTEHREKVCRCLEEHGFSVEEIAEEGEWCAIAARLL